MYPPIWQLGKYESKSLTDEISISEIAQKLNLSTSRLRYYEKIGLINPVRRRGAQRYYAHDVFHRLSIIMLAQKAGFSLAEIQTWIEDFIANQPTPEFLAFLREKVAQFDAEIARINSQKQLIEQALQLHGLTLASLEELA